MFAYLLRYYSNAPMLLLLEINFMKASIVIQMNENSLVY